MDGNVSNAVVSAEEIEIPTREDLLKLARGMVPTLVERAQMCEELGCAPDETIKDFKEAGFFKINYSFIYSFILYIYLICPYSCRKSCYYFL